MLLRATTAALLLLLPACGDDAAGESSAGSSSSTGGELSDFRQAAHDRGIALCDHVGDCCGTHGWPHDPDACRAFVAGELGANESSFDAAGGAVDETALAACIEATVAIAATCVPDAATYRAWEIACERAATGTRPPGTTCTTDLECAPPAVGTGRCQGQDGGAPAICVHLVPASAGGTCARDALEQHDCVEHSPSGDHPELFCSTAGVCTPRGQQGEGPCSTGQCAPGLYCDGACVPFIDEGEPCVFTDACGPDGACVDETCVALLPLGAACTNLAECASRRCLEVCIPATLVVDSVVCGG